MSEPKRYERIYHKDYVPEGMEEHYNGKWVSYADYARLKAEVERLKAEPERLAFLLNNAYLDKERLIKAGDKLAKRTEFFQKRWDADELCQEVKAWNAAKEGKQS